MPDLVIAPADPRSPGPAALLAASHALMETLFPPEENHFLSPDALAAAGIVFLVATEGDTALGCAALSHNDGYGEVKSMFVAPGARGRGIARALLGRVESEARRAGLSRLRLETGDALGAAIALYARHGFRKIGPFGDYVANSSSVFMEKIL